MVALIFYYIGFEEEITMPVSLTMHQKVIAMVESYEVFEGKTLKYTVKKKILAAGADFDIFDAAGNKVGLVDQKVMNMVKTFDITPESAKLKINNKKIIR